MLHKVKPNKKLEEQVIHSLLVDAHHALLHSKCIGIYNGLRINEVRVP